MTDYLIGLVGALGVADQDKRKEIAANMEEWLTTDDEKEAIRLAEKLKTDISTDGRFESAKGLADNPMDALENGMSAILLKEGRFFRSYAIVVAVLSQEAVSQSVVNEINKTMRKLAGRFTNLFIQPVERQGIEGYEVRLFSIGLHGTDSGK